MYGSVMIGTLAGSAEPVREAMEVWLKERGPHAVGFVDAGVLIGDDGETVVTFARFTDQESYTTLADDPDQDAWYRERLAPALDGEPRWIDGEWTNTPG